MKIKIVSIIACFIFSVALANAQYRVDSMCGAKVMLDKKGKLLARYILKCQV